MPKRKALAAGARMPEGTDGEKRAEQGSEENGQCKSEGAVIEHCSILFHHFLLPLACICICEQHGISLLVTT